MGQELKEPHQAGAPTGLESNDAALTEQPTNIPTTGLNLTQPARLDLSLPPAELKPLACARHQEKLAAAQRAYRDYFLDVAGDPAAAPLPQALLRSRPCQTKPLNSWTAPLLLVSASEVRSRARQRLPCPHCSTKQGEQEASQSWPRPSMPITLSGRRTWTGPWRTP